MHYIFLLGRILFSSLFLLKSVHHFSGHALEHATEKGIAMAPIVVPIAGMLTLLGGLSILLGYKAKVGAWLLIVFLVPATFMMHAYWQQTPYTPAALMDQYCFLKNISLIGACLMITHFGSGPMSLKK